MRFTRTAIWAAVVCVALMVASRPASASVITFETLPPGSSTFGITAAQTLVFNNYQGSGIDVTFAGGVILTSTTNLPANPTNIYGTADFGDATLANPLTVTFSQPITNFFLDVYNGMTTDADYRLYDNNGHSAAFTLVPNTSSGQTEIGFAAAGTIVSIQGLPENTDTWDFFIDNIHFNEDLPGVPVPEPASMMLLSSGLVGLAVRAWRKRRQ